MKIPAKNIVLLFPGRLGKIFLCGLVFEALCVFGRCEMAFSGSKAAWWRHARRTEYPKIEKS